jgi:threonylcarbamoyladenosine tRNA methylthiotransferase MtaB
MRIGFRTLGCKLNQFETEALASSFRERGHVIVSQEGEAEAYVINTCTVTGRADHKSRALVRSISRKHPGAVLIVTGCSAELEAKSLCSLGENVLIVPQSEKGKLLALAERVTQAIDTPAVLTKLRTEATPSARDAFAYRVKGLSFHSRAFLKVQDGCDAWCAYCRVPQARGPSRSLSADEVIRRAVELESLGHREIVITGVNICSYRCANLRLHHLIKKLLKATSRVRFRLSSLEPESVTEVLANSLSNNRICAHFHLSVQSGSDSVLARMKRRYQAKRVVEGMGLLRAAKSDPFIAADFITGFPAETEQEHRETVRLIQEVEFAALHVFAFSPRPDTAAAKLRPMVPQRVRDERSRELASISRGLLDSYARRWQGRQVEVLIETRARSDSQSALTRGLSENYLKVMIEGVPTEADLTGKIVRARLTRTGEVSAASFVGFA